MININKLNEQENRFYKSALAFCEGNSLKNNGNLEKSINQTLIMFKDHVSNIDNLKEYLIQETKVVEWYRCEYEDENFECICCERDEVFEEATKFEEEHGTLFNIFLVDENDEVLETIL